MLDFYNRLCYNYIIDSKQRGLLLNTTHTGHTMTRKEHTKEEAKKFYSRAGMSYSNKGMMKSGRLDADINNATVRAFERGGAERVESASSLKVRKYEIIGGKKFAVIS